MIQTHVKKEHLELLISQSSKNNMPYCGDSYYYTVTDDYFICVLADGLGSGQYAYESSSAVTEVVKSNHNLDVETLMKMGNEVLVNKRGAAVSILKVNFKTREFIYSSVGNIRFFCCLPGGKLIYPLPVTGYLSGRMQKYHTQYFHYEPNSTFILHSDGLQMVGAKRVLGSKAPLQQTANLLLEENSAYSDDTTFLLGSLL
ncbi:PP2C family serine/threonine-protein phosphatase [Peribacillus deserti]|uniref:Phosphoserine phosphatase n=1 Tax=Peribacillus deserti TaxID=673318 RepID=A0A2N5M0S4_9BACI|nr:PP2C family serine/threonine-protein phosphatase [Peribacillus deserti]PLT27950.1 phosphoserine phosphatase [Peribacillus deserti]